MSITNITTYKAMMFNEAGEFIDYANMPKTDNTFKYKGKAYNIDRKHSSYFKWKGLVWDTRYYFYNIDNCEPLFFNQKRKVIIEPELYNTFLETEVARKLNNTGKKNFADFLNPKVLLGAVVVAIIGYYLLTGGLIN